MGSPAGLTGIFFFPDFLLGDEVGFTGFCPLGVILSETMPGLPKESEKDRTLPSSFKFFEAGTSDFALWPILLSTSVGFF